MNAAKVCVEYYFAIFFLLSALLIPPPGHDKGKNLEGKNLASEARLSLRSLGRAKAQPLQRSGPLQRS